MKFIHRALIVLAPLCLVAPVHADIAWHYVANYPTPRPPYSFVIGNDGAFWVGGWRSIDGGVTWNDGIVDTNGVTLTPDSYYVTDVAVGSGGVMFAGDISGNLYASTNNGASWYSCAPTSPINPGDTSRAISESIAPNGDFYVLKRWSTPATLNGLWRSTDLGHTWTRTSLADSDATHLDEAYVGPNGTVYVISGAYSTSVPPILCRSRDNGASWVVAQLNFYPMSNWRQGRTIWADSVGHVVVGCIQGMAASTDGGASWSICEVGGYGGTIVRNSHNVLFAACGTYHGQIIWSGDYGLTWHYYWPDVPTSTYIGILYHLLEIAVDAQDTLYAALLEGMYRNSAGGLVGVEAPSSRGRTLALESIAPNPSTRTMTLRWSAPTLENTAVEAFDVRGRRVGRWNVQPDNGAFRELKLETRGWAPGVYLVRLSSDAASVSGKLLVVD